MQTARRVARGIGWLFVAVIGYHVVLAGVHAVEAVSDRNWSRALEQGTIALVGAALVIAAIINAARTPKSRRQPTDDST